MTSTSAPPTAGSPTTVDAMTDEARAASLRRMKLVAASLLGLAAAIYLVTLALDGPHAEGTLGYVQAGAEAAMVGALADWFAVTALFRHPLGLPIPHTAIIPTRKDQMGEALSQFVGTNFLTDDVVRRRIGDAEVTRRVGMWLRQPLNASRVAGELGRALRSLLAVLDEEQMRTLIERVLAERVERTEIAPALGHLLAGVVDDRAHAGIVDVLVERTHNWVATNRRSIVDVVVKQAPPWSPKLVDDIVADRIHMELVRFLAAIRDDPDHDVRQAIDRLLRQFADDLRENPQTRARVEAAKVEMYNHPDVQRSVSQIWATAKRIVLEAADDPDSELRVRTTGALVQVGDSLATDSAIQERLDVWVAGSAASLVAEYRGELTSVITDTVARWDGKQTATRIEQVAGRDLQFIRINGTVVGALAGLGIHAVTQILS